MTALFLTPAYVLAQESDLIGGLCSGSSFEISTGAGSVADCTSGDATEKFNNLLRKAINLLSAIVGIIAVIMIIIGGLKYITSGGSDSNVTGAKNTILYAVIGLVIVAIAQVIVRFVLSSVETTVQ